MSHDIKLEILSASYKENQNYAKELYNIKSFKAEKQWKESRKILKELIDYKQSKIKKT